ncbi:signal peptidase I [Bowmanella sp. JS7-9]|uniref:Signal peptidase I n=1 Tax=Pseudobowmanella zhangzhouensis TaxID=1537679 RepID=A0ABW1XGW7_9ALTE|nr:signal peptidase I [Bowmanella sp. JS7-9]TBX25895.1 signal peptidase [Bowmanella sp. JS7-9]
MANYFSILLVVVTLASGLIWLADKYLWEPKRRLAVETAKGNDGVGEEYLAKLAAEPAMVDTAKQIFPVIAFVLVLRSFLYEPFQIPSGSMMPTLLVGDFILVEKYAYGLRDPVTRTKFLETGEPERGDIVVFKYPLNPSQDYIKRVIGLPGDTVIYKNKQITVKPACREVNCPPAQTMALTAQENSEFLDGPVWLEQFGEQLGDVEHNILRNPSRNVTYPFQQNATRYNEWIVPQGAYFVMGDNRDNSMDSRYWGFVPEENLVGKAVAIWISFEFDHAPDSSMPGWIPTGVRFNRVGGIH